VRRSTGKISTKKEAVGGVSEVGGPCGGLLGLPCIFT